MEAGVYKRENNSGTDGASLHLDLPATYNLYRDLKKKKKKTTKNNNRTTKKSKVRKEIYNSCNSKIFAFEFSPSPLPPTYIIIMSLTDRKHTQGAPYSSLVTHNYGIHIKRTILG